MIVAQPEMLNFSQQQLNPQEERLLLLALFFHGPEWDFIQRRYLPTKSGKQLKQHLLLIRKQQFQQLN